VPFGIRTSLNGKLAASFNSFALISGQHFAKLTCIYHACLKADSRLLTDSYEILMNRGRGSGNLGFGM
jgi:hypothetical protein